MPSHSGAPRGVADSLLLRKARDVSIETAAQQLRLIHELKQRKERSGERSPDPKPAGRSSGLEDFLFKVAQLSVTSYERWLHLTSDHLPDIVDALGQMRGQAQRAPSSGVVVRAAGAPGAKVWSDAFRVENPFDQAVSASFAAPEFRLVDDGPRESPGFVAPVVFEWVGKPKSKRTTGKGPANPLGPGSSFAIPPGKPAQFRIGIELVPSFAQPGDYVGRARILSPRRAIGEVVVYLTVRPARGHRS
jgi:hypothetical protein